MEHVLLPVRGGKRRLKKKHWHAQAHDIEHQLRKLAKAIDTQRSKRFAITGISRDIFALGSSTLQTGSRHGKSARRERNGRDVQTVFSAMTGWRESADGKVISDE